MSQTSTWQDVRATRSRLPGLAGGGGSRQSTFGASLQQAQELAEAAAHAGYSSKPILLFYCFSQASRAICASRLKTEWSPVGHGLSAVDNGNELPDIEVKAAGGGLYQQAMKALGEEALGGRVSIKELWSAMPEFDSIPIPGRDFRSLTVRPAVSLDAAQDLDVEAGTRDLFLLVDGLPEGAGRDEMAAALQKCPGLADAEIATYPTGLPTGLLSDEEDRDGIAYRRVVLPAKLFPVVKIAGSGQTLRDHRDAYHSAAPGPINDSPDVRRAVPAIGEPSQVLGPISSWWALLLGLSSVSRYQPAIWSKALNVDRSPIAVGLERILDIAQDVLPHYVVAALNAPLAD